jgi:chorismate mutase/prephenate dehydratase
MSAKNARTSDGDLKALRRRLDETDRAILDLLNDRAEIVLDIGHLKNRSGRSVYVPSREEEVFAKLAEASRGPLGERAVRAIWREVMSASRALEKALKISYLGPEGTFTHEAARRKFGSAVEPIPEGDIESIFASVVRGASDHGVVPIENSVGGSIDEVLDLFQTHRVPVIAEVVLPIAHHLIGPCKKSEIETVYSRSIAFRQCRRFLSSSLGGAKKVPLNSTAEAVKKAGQSKRSAAIASRLASELYGVPIIEENIEDDPSNQTRFWVLGGETGPPTGRDKTSVMFAIKNKAGVLHDMLNSFKRHGVNLTKIESRPSRRGTWDYVFFIDMEGHIDEEHVAKALAALETKCSYLQVLGSYPV